jgi:hypothetical protein
MIDDEKKEVDIPEVKRKLQRPEYNETIAKEYMKQFKQIKDVANI